MRNKLKLEKINENQSTNGALFRILMFKYPKWFKALILYIDIPLLMEKNSVNHFSRENKNQWGKNT